MEIKEASISDLCKCGHTRGAHYKNLGHGYVCSAGMFSCKCGEFELHEHSWYEHGAILRCECGAYSANNPPNPLDVIRNAAMREETAKDMSAEVPRYDLIHAAVLECLADRLAHGQKDPTKADTWKGKLDNADYMRDRLNHAVGHMLNLSNGRFEEDDEWGNLGALLFWCMMKAIVIKRDRCKKSSS